MAYDQSQKVSGATAVDFGQIVAMRGYYAITSDEGVNGYFYRRQIDNTWSQVDTFTMLSGTGATATFGDSLDIGNEYFVAGDPSYFSNTGRVGIYAISDPSTVIQKLDGVTSGDSFGCSVAINDDYILVGAQGSDTNRGEVHLYLKDAGATWTAYSGNPISASFRVPSDFFGGSIDMTGDTLIIGAQGDNNKTGAVYIFEKNAETNLWEESQKLFASDGDINDQFGESVSVSGNYFVAGASLSESVAGEVSSGSAYVFKYSTTWFEVDKLVGVDESIYSGNHFGQSVDINGDYIIVGSPAARNQGVVDIFYKKRSWGHLTKLVGSDSSIDDLFGTAVAIDGKHSVVGAPSEGSFGSMYFYEDPPVRLRLAQEFDVDRGYLPSKASVYLKRVGSNTSNYWSIYNTSSTVIDATNFSTITYGRNVVTFGDDFSGFTGNGYMYLDNNINTGYTTVNYPIKAIVADTFNLWIRCLSPESSAFQADIILDGVKVKTITEAITDPSALTWSWVNTTLVLPDVREHVLGIRIKENGAAIDKIYIDASNTIPFFEGPDYGESPYVTVHMRVYDSNGTNPNNSLFIYDYKNSIDQIVQSDWYNFNIRALDSNHGFTSANNFTGSYFFVMSSSGTTHDNFVVWEMADNDDPSTVLSPSAFMF